MLQYVIQFLKMKMKMKITQNINNIHVMILSSTQCKPMVKTFAEGITALHRSNPSFYNHIFKDSRMSTLTALMNLLFSGEVSTLSDFYTICEKYGYSGKNNAISLIEFLIHTDRLVLKKGKDRRTKKPELTEKGLGDLKNVIKTLIKPLLLLDPSLNDNTVDEEGFFNHYYQRASRLMGADRDLYDTQKYTLNIYNKSAGLVFMLLIYLDIINWKIIPGEKIRIAHFTNMCFDLGVSNTHINNLLQVLSQDGALKNNGRNFIIEKKFASDVEKFVTLYLANIYFLISC